uniref:Uncharacterized protein n=1 Tax=Anguilla anguilla TaxID=7936 RepID=A0A0E9SDZ4_ANGAN
MMTLITELYSYHTLYTVLNCFNHNCGCFEDYL